MLVLSCSGHTIPKALLSQACSKPLHKQVQSIPTLKATLSSDNLKSGERRSASLSSDNLKSEERRSASLSSDNLKSEERRSANYHPTVWNLNQIQSLSTEYTYELYEEKLQELKKDAGRLITSTRDSVAQLKIIDQVQRLGVAYHFEQEIMEVINLKGPKASGHLEADSLHFRLLRQNGFSVASEFCNRFRDKNGKFKESLREDTSGLLALYEASHLGHHEDDALEEAKNFTTKHLKKLSFKGNILDEQVQQSLEIPLHWRMPRNEARCFLDLYEKDTTRSSLLLELAKLDYNLIQSLYQKELKELARWWEDLGIAKKLSFSRDRLMENFLWAMSICSDPQQSQWRMVLTKLICILTAVDDMYDVYGSLEELELFTKAVNRWDMGAIEEIPEYMRICYLAMLNFVNEVKQDVLKEYGLDISCHIVEAWKGLCRSYLVEARWFYRKYRPTSKEYLKNAWISVGGHALMAHCYSLLGQGNNITKYSVDPIKGKYRELIYWASLITRLNDDLGTSTAEIQRGDVSKSIECYMKEEGVSEEQARQHIKMLINNAWKKLNKESIKPYIPKPFVKMCMNMARTSQFIYQYGDGMGTSIGSTKDRLKSLVIDPIPMDLQN